MRSLLSVAALAALTNGQITIIQDTTNECWFNEGAEYMGVCSTIYYWYCDTYNVLPQDRCILRTLSDTILTTESDYIDISYWSYAQDKDWIAQLEQESNAAASSNAKNDNSFNSFFADFSSESSTNLMSFASTTFDPNLHVRTADWVDPFENVCKLLNTNPVSYDLETKPKLNMMVGLCGFKIQLSNRHEYAPA